MSVDTARKLMALGMQGELAKYVADALDSAGASVAWDDVTGKPATFPATVPVASATTATTATTATSAATLTTGRTITVNFAAAAAAPTFNGSANVTASIARGAAVPNCTVAADGTSAGTQLNALLAALRTVGVIAP